MATYRTIALGGSTSGTSDRSVAITPAVGDLLVAAVFVSTNTNDTPTMSDNNASGGTWTRILVGNVVISTVNHRLAFFVRDNLMANTTSTTVTAATGSNTSGVIHVVAISGMNRAGLDAVRSQGQQNNMAAGTPAPVLNQAALTGNVTIAGVGSADTTTTPPTGWTERGDTNFATPTVALQTSTRDSGFTGTTITFGAAQSTTFASYAVELDTTAPPVDLVIANATHSHTAGNVALTQAHSLTVANASHGQTAQNLALTENANLAIANGAHGHTAEQLTLAVSTNLVIQNGTHSHTAENAALTQVHQLAVQNASHGQVADQPTLTQVHSLAINNASHGHTSSNLALTQNHVLGIQNASHSHSAENVSLGVAGSLSIQDATHGHTAQNVSLTTEAQLTIHSATHTHSAENLELASFATLAIQSALHSHNADGLQLAQLHALAVANASHAHTAGNVTIVFGNLGGPVDGPTRVVIGNPTNRVVIAGTNRASVSSSGGSATTGGSQNTAEVLD